MGLAVGLFLLLPLLVCPVGCKQKAPLGSPQRPLRLLLYPANKGAQAEQARRVLAEHLSKQLGLQVTTEVPVDYSHSVKDLGTGAVDLAFLNDLSFLLAEEIYGVQARLRILRRGSKEQHRGQLLVRRDSGIERLDQLAGKRVAFVDPYSVTGFVLTAHLLKKSGIVVEGTFVGSHEEAVRQVFTGAVDAAATYDNVAPQGQQPLDVRSKLVKRYPEINQQLRTLIQTSSVPNEPVVIRKGLDKSLAEKVLIAIEQLAQNPQTAQALRQLGDIEGFQRASNDDYLQLRTMIQEVGKKVEDMVPGGYQLKLQATK